MRLRHLLPFLPVLLAGCSQYATVREIRPGFHPIHNTVAAVVSANTDIANALLTGRGKSEARIADYLKAIQTSSQVLASNPGDKDAREAYNYAVARVFTEMYRGNLYPWSHPVKVADSSGDFTLSYVRDPRPGYDAALYDFTPADQYDVSGSYITHRTVKAGLGAPLVAEGKDIKKDAAQTFTLDRTYYGVTALIQIDTARRATISFRDPLATEDVQFEGRTFPLAADFTVPVAVMLESENPKKLEISRALRPGKYMQTMRIVRLQPYDPNKTVVLLVHGLIDTPATWTPLINTLRGDPEIRQHYQFWFYSYPSGYPYPYPAAILRHDLDAIETKYPLHHKMVVIGHSMGSLIARLLITDSGDKLWLAMFGKPPAQTNLSPDSRAFLEDSLIFQHRPEIGRVIFISAPHRGATMATNFIGRFGAGLIRMPAKLISIQSAMSAALTSDPGALKLRRVPTSVDTLAPNNRFVLAINTVPLTPGIPYHSIMGDRGKGGNKNHTPPISTDGVVPYWSSHLDGAQSELIVPSQHPAHQNPKAIAEVDRILRLNVGLPPEQ
jgi:pimeloyl-ACP methyl ester carboxylesterase